MHRLYGWFDERLGINRMLKALLDEEIRGGARWAYVLGSAVLFVFLVQALTGIFLTMYYVPSSDHAHVSVAYIQKALPGGSLVRGLHYYGASAFIILILAHMTQVFLFGAYKKKRELTWLAGGVLLLLGLGFGFTGYLLPWDQEAYFGTKVGTSIAGEIPVIGSVQQHIMLGGSEITSLTLSRFFMVHAFLLPLGLALFAGLHILLFRKAGPAGPYDEKGSTKVDRFYPRQLWKDTVFAFVIFVTLLLLTKLSPAHLGPQADPTSDYLARPAWYFLPLFQLLKYFPGRLSLIPTVGMPAFVFGLIFALPFIDRHPERHPLRRPVATAVFLMALAGAIGLGVVSRIQDNHNPEFSAKLREQSGEADGFLKARFVPQDNGRSIPVTPGQTTGPAGLQDR
ncbi:MAG TPA: cytochrome bc complex cytochrome b subunit, partial [Blastocatellia bacterium]|nr:cytochrome bc complex cytochrome b subunit [Blastocatellia bacterium]